MSVTIEPIGPYNSRSMRRALFLACFALAALAGGALLDDFDTAEWKREVADGYFPYGKLGYEDFPVNDGHPARYLMHTIGFLHYSFRADVVVKQGKYTAVISQISVRSGFDQNRSWKKTTFTERKALLAHEQGHLDINELHAANFRKAKKPEGQGSNPKAAVEDLSVKLDDLCERCGNAARIEQDKYDEETKHGAAEEKQREWIEAIRKRFRDGGLKYWDKN
jgi:hypothetical protein